jgi:acylphosphatase
MQTRRYVVRGRVQAVGFREFTRRTADRLGLTGWVRNLSDGRTVEAIASGPEPSLQLFENALRSGPPGANISEMRVEDYPDAKMDHFELRE